MHCTPKSDQCPFEFAGFSLAGAPGDRSGHNDRIAWGFTFANEDVMDLFIEKVNPDNPNQYEVNGNGWISKPPRKQSRWLAATRLNSRFDSTGTAPLSLRSYGPLKDEGDPRDKEFVPFKDRTGIDLPQNYVIALSWTALSPSSPFDGIWGFDRAKTGNNSAKLYDTFMSRGKTSPMQMSMGILAIKPPAIFQSARRVMAPCPSQAGQGNTTGQVTFHLKKCPIHSIPSRDISRRSIIRSSGDDYDHFIAKDWDYGFRAKPHCGDDQECARQN